MVTRHAIRRLLVYAATGLFTTIIVAAVLSLWDRTNKLHSGGVLGTSVVAHDGNRWWVSQRRFVGETSVLVTPVTDLGDIDQVLDSMRRTAREYAHANGDWQVRDDLPVPGWAVFPVTTMQQIGNRATGWPCLALRCFGVVGMQPGAAGVRWSGCVELTADRRIGYLPMWSGLVIDTAAYSGIWFAVGAAIVQLRRARRRRKGLCSACAYNLTGIQADICPECGLVLAKRAPHVIEGM